MRYGTYRNTRNEDGIHDLAVPAGIIPGSNLLTRGSTPFSDYTWRQVGDIGIFPANDLLPFYIKIRVQ